MLKTDWSRSNGETEDMIYHTIEPVFDSRSKVLILGTIPSPKSREFGFYYAHPQNRFWRILAELFGVDIPESIEEKKALLLKKRIALWDVLKSCEIIGADDSSIREPVANDIASVLSKTHINAVFTTGGKAATLYKKLCQKQIGMVPLNLPSTSPANCRYYSYYDLVRAYSKILEYL